VHADKFIAAEKDDVACSAGLASESPACTEQASVRSEEHVSANAEEQSSGRVKGNEKRKRQSKASGRGGGSETGGNRPRRSIRGAAAKDQTSKDSHNQKRSAYIEDGEYWHKDGRHGEFKRLKGHNGGTFYWTNPGDTKKSKQWFEYPEKELKLPSLVVLDDLNINTLDT